MRAALRSRRSLLAVSVLAAAALLPASLASPAAAMPAVEPSGTWGPPRQVDPGFGAYAMTFAWSQYGTRVHAISYNDDGNRYYQRSDDDAATWQDRVLLGGANGGHSLIATGGGYVYVVSESDYTSRDNRLLVRRNSSDGAASGWSAPKAITPKGSGIGCTLPTMAASGASVHIATTRPTRKGCFGRGEGRGEVVLVSSRDHGATWTRHVIARLDLRLSRATPVVAVSGRHVVVAWRSLAGKKVVRARISHDSGRTWGPTTTLGAGTGGISAAALGSRLAVASGRIGAGAWVRVHTGGSWKTKRFVVVGKATERKRPVVALHGTTQVGVLVGRYPGGVPAPILQWHESPDNGVTWAPRATIGDEEEGQVQWSSTGALTVAFGSTDLYYLRTRS